MNRFLIRFLKDASGATAIEYGLITAIIALVIVTGLLSNVGTSIGQTMTSIAANVSK